MTKRNCTIQQIVVHRKLNDGDILICVEACKGDRIRIVGRPFFQPWHPGADTGSWKIHYVDIKTNQTRIEHLGDIGWPGFEYDDRPCKWVASEWDLSEQAKLLDQWYQRALSAEDYDPCY